MTALTGTGALVRLVLRRDRILLPVVALALALVVVVQGAGLDAVYDTAEARQQYAATNATSAGIAAFNGPGFALTTSGGIFVAEINFLILLVLALTSAFVVIRHTRAEEEAGRAELTGSAVVGRHARLAAALIVMVAANLVMGALIVGGMRSIGLPAGGSVAFGLAMAAAGCVFAGVGAVAAQIAESARTARGIAAAAFGAALLPRAVGDASRASDPDGGLASLSWLSPVGWAQQIRAFGGERWWVLGLLAAGTIALVGVAVVLSVHRDVGSGLVVPRLGPPAAAQRLASPLALAWRLHRNALIGWTVGVVLTMVAFGALTSDVEELAEGNDTIAEYVARLGGTDALVDAFIAVSLTYVGLAASAYAVATVLRLRGEETSLHAEPVLATAVSRWQWAASHLIVAAVGTAVLLVGGGLALGLGYGLVVGDLGEIPRVLGGALQQIPAAWVVAGIALALFGLVPRLTVVGAWLFVVAFLLINQLGDALDLDQWLRNLSPFNHLPRLPGDAFSATPVLWLLVVAVGLAVVGLAGFRRRDVTGA